MTSTPILTTILFLLLVAVAVVATLWALDLLLETVDEYKARENAWRAIDVRCSMERHPSSQVSVYDWADPANNDSLRGGWIR